MRRPIAFVTGASRGIGKAASLALAESGYDVVLTARSVAGGEVHEYSPTSARTLQRAMPGNLEETAAGVRERGGRALVVRLDLMQRDSIDAAVDRALSEWGRIDLLLNNAIYQGPGLLDRVLALELGQVEAVFRGNVTHQLVLIQRVLPAMLERKQGVIINMVSAAGMGDPPVPPERGGWGWAYGASKAAFIRLGGSLAVEHAGSGVAFYSVDPGLVLTESMREQGLTEDLVAAIGGGAPPTVPAAVIAWLATDPAAARWHGKTLHAQELCRDLRLVPGWPRPS